MMGKFVHLHVHSTYSQFDGMTEIPALFSRCEELGMPGVALTDHGNIRGMREFFEQAKLHPTVKPIAGCEFYLTDNFDHRLKDRDHRKCFHLILLAKNETGFRNLFRLMIFGYKQGFFNGRPSISHGLLEQYHEGLICTSACIGGEVAQALLSDDMDAACASVLWYRNMFGEDFYLEVDLHPNVIEHRIYPLQQIVAEKMFELGEYLGVKVIAANDVHFLKKSDADLHDRMLLAKTGGRADDPERFRYTGQEWLKSYDGMAAVFKGHEEALANTLEVLDKIERYELPDQKELIEIAKYITKQQKNMNKSNSSTKLDAYLQYIGKQPMLTQEQESELAARIQTGDKIALYQLMKGNLRFVVSLLLPYQRNGKSLVQLIRAGNGGLKKAAERFVPSGDYRFIAYAAWHIRQSIEDISKVE